MSRRTIVLVILAVVLFAIAATVFAFRNPITLWWKQRAADATAGKEHATDDAEGRKLETQGTTALAAAANELAAAARSEGKRTHVLEVQTRADPAVATAIPGDELARLRAHDLSLCGDKIVRCDDRPAAAPGAPADGGGAVQP
jgi:hypothetical protein